MAPAVLVVAAVAGWLATTTAQQILDLGKMAAVVEVETQVTAKRPAKQSEAQAVTS